MFSFVTKNALSFKLSYRSLVWPKMSVPSFVNFTAESDQGIYNGSWESGNTTVLITSNFKFLRYRFRNTYLTQEVDLALSLTAAKWYNGICQVTYDKQAAFQELNSENTNGQFYSTWHLEIVLFCDVTIINYSKIMHWTIRVVNLIAANWLGFNRVVRICY